MLAKVREAIDDNRITYINGLLMWRTDYSEWVPIESDIAGLSITRYCGDTRTTVNFAVTHETFVAATRTRSINSIVIDYHIQDNTSFYTFGIENIKSKRYVRVTSKRSNYKFMYYRIEAIPTGLFACQSTKCDYLSYMIDVIYGESAMAFKYLIYRIVFRPLYRGLHCELVGSGGTGRTYTLTAITNCMPKSMLYSLDNSYISVDGKVVNKHMLSKMVGCKVILIDDTPEVLYDDSIKKLHSGEPIGKNGECVVAVSIGSSNYIRSHDVPTHLLPHNLTRSEVIRARDMPPIDWASNINMNQMKQQVPRLLISVYGMFAGKEYKSSYEAGLVTAFGTDADELKLMIDYKLNKVERLRLLDATLLNWDICQHFGIDYTSFQSSMKILYERYEGFCNTHGYYHFNGRSSATYNFRINSRDYNCRQHIKAAESKSMRSIALSTYNDSSRESLAQSAKSLQDSAMLSKLISSSNNYVSTYSADKSQSIHAKHSSVHTIDTGDEDDPLNDNFDDLF